MEKHNVKKVVLLTAAIILLGFAVICHDVTKIKNWQLLVEFALSLIVLGTLLSQLKNKSNSVKVILVTMLVFFILTWILPAAYFSGEYVDQGRVQMGLFDLFNYPLTAISYFGYIAFYLIFVGGFYGVLFKIPAYRTFLDKIVGATKGIESLVLSIFVIVNALLVSICGVHIGIALFIPFIVSIVFLMGYDKIVAAYVTVGSIISGLIGTTFASANITILTGTFSLPNDYQIGVRIVLLLASVALVIFNMLSYKGSDGWKILAIIVDCLIIAGLVFIVIGLFCGTTTQKIRIGIYCFFAGTIIEIVCIVYFLIKASGSLDTWLVNLIKAVILVFLAWILWRQSKNV